MRNVKRLQEPASLQRSAAKWTKQLLDAIKSFKNRGPEVTDNYYNKYKKDDVLKRLKKMYGDDEASYCCYCESITETVSFEQIEHRKPKKNTIDKYPEDTYNWKNLHLVCEKCNKYKDNQYDERNEILDATSRIKIGKHLGYELTPTNGIYRKTLSKRGITTVKHCKLDRKPLRKARLAVWNETIKLIQEIKRYPNAPENYTAIEILKDKCLQKYGSLIKFLLDLEQLGSD